MKPYSLSSGRRCSKTVSSGLLDFVSGLFLLVVPAFLCGCEARKAVELPPPIVTVTEAVQRQVQDWDEYTGRLAPMGTGEVRPRASGYITEVKFTDGDLVKKGQPLFIIDPRPYQADYDRAKAEVDRADAALTLAAADFERARQLRDKGVTAVGDFDQRSATYKQASAVTKRVFATPSMADSRLASSTCAAWKSIPVTLPDAPTRDASIRLTSPGPQPKSATVIPFEMPASTSTSRPAAE